MTAEQKNRAKELTLQLGNLIAEYKSAKATERTGLAEQLTRVAEERWQLLGELMDNAPAEMLRLALPTSLRENLPPGLQALLEQTAEVDGELEILHVDHEDPRQSRYRYFLNTFLGERFSLHFATKPPALLTGEKVRVGGLALYEAQESSETDGAMAVDSGEDSVLILEADGSEIVTTVAAAALPNTFGAQRVAVLLVNFQDNPDDKPFTPTQARDFVLGKVNDFYRENSYGQTWLSGDVFGWYTMSITTSNCSSIQSYADAAASAAGVDLSLYARIVYFIAPSACGGNSGTVGGSPSRAYIRAGLDLRVVTHELGHNLGLLHSHGLNCSGGVLASDCIQDEYADLLDVMGWSNQSAAHFNVFQKEWLGWLNSDPSPPITEVTTDGNYTVSPTETNDANPKGLRILRSIDSPSGKKNWYFVEYRQPIGFDQFLFDPADPFKYPDNLLNGVVLHLGTEADRNSSVLLDMTPDSLTTTVYSDLRDPALVAGVSYTDAASGLTITPLWTDSTGATVSVSFGTETCARANPSLWLSPSESAWVAPGIPVTYTVTVANNDNSACGVSQFDLSAAFPAGWTATLANPSLSLEPGASASTTLTVTSPSSAADGFYSVAVTASNRVATGYEASGSVTYVVSAVTANQAPIAVDDSAATTEGIAVTIPVLINDWDPEGDALTTTSVTEGANGKVSLKADGTVVYTPNPRFKGSDSFGYQITDGFGTATAIVSVKVSKSTGGNGGGKR